MFPFPVTLSFHSFTFWRNIIYLFYFILIHLLGVQKIFQYRIVDMFCKWLTVILFRRMLHLRIDYNEYDQPTISPLQNMWMCIFLRYYFTQLPKKLFFSCVFLSVFFPLQHHIFTFMYVFLVTIYRTVTATVGFITEFCTFGLHVYPDVSIREWLPEGGSSNGQCFLWKDLCLAQKLVFSYQASGNVLKASESKHYQETIKTFFQCQATSFIKCFPSTQVYFSQICDFNHENV